MICPLPILVSPRLPGEHGSSELHCGVEAVCVLPLRGALPERRHVSGAEGEGAADDTHPLLRRQLREGAEDRGRSARALPGQPR